LPPGRCLRLPVLQPALCQLVTKCYHASPCSKQAVCASKVQTSSARPHLREEIHSNERRNKTSQSREGIVQPKRKRANLGWIELWSVDEEHNEGCVGEHASAEEGNDVQVCTRFTGIRSISSQQWRGEHAGPNHEQPQTSPPSNVVHQHHAQHQPSDLQA
jgi:hypothetical protein